MNAGRARHHAGPKEEKIILAPMFLYAVAVSLAPTTTTTTTLSAAPCRSKIRATEKGTTDPRSPETVLRRRRRLNTTPGAAHSVGLNERVLLRRAREYKRTAHALAYVRPLLLLLRRRYDNTGKWRRFRTTARRVPVESIRVRGRPYVYYRDFRRVFGRI